jgi:threonylcarbamoyladenosine tRNA methylthiotransferase MtaB
MVTGKAALQSRQAARRMLRAHPGALVIVTGCHAQVNPEVFASMPKVNYVVGNSLKDRIPQLPGAEGKHGHGLTLVEEVAGQHLFQDLPITKFGRRTRAFVKIQDGCDAFCAYCIIPLARGRSRSLGPEIVIERIGSLKEQGYSEVVLCGIHIGRYGKDLNPATTLTDLVRSVDRAQGVHRLRLSSIEPMEVSENLIGHLAASERICPHLHIPLQSGDNDVLKAMNRPYSSQSYRDLIYHITSTVPHVAIGVDVMAGFPGESEKAFENTCRLIEELPVAYLHVFPFSVQKGTAAERLTQRLSPETIKKRCRYLRQLGQAKRKVFCESFIGSTFEILVEGKRDRATGHLKGFTGNYIPVLIEGDDRLFHQIVQVKIDGIKDGRVRGKLTGTFN